MGSGLSCLRRAHLSSLLSGRALTILDFMAQLSTQSTRPRFVGLELLSDDGEVGLVGGQAQHDQISWNESSSFTNSRRLGSHSKWTLGTPSPSQEGKSHHQLHTGSGACWGHGWVELSKGTDTNQPRKQENMCKVAIRGCGHQIKTFSMKKEQPISSLILLIHAPLCLRMKSMILCSPSPGTLASDRKTCTKANTRAFSLLSSLWARNESLHPKVLSR